MSKYRLILRIFKQLSVDFLAEKGVFMRDNRMMQEQLCCQKYYAYKAVFLSDIKKDCVGQKGIFALSALFYLQKVKWNSDWRKERMFYLKLTK